PGTDEPQRSGQTWAAGALFAQLRNCMPDSLRTSRRHSLLISSPAQLLLWPLALVAAGCNDHGGNINAIADLRVEVPDSIAADLEYPVLVTLSMGYEGRGIAADLEYPVLVTLSMGYEGREENTTTNANQTVLVFCHAPDEPFVYRDSVQLRTACKREDFYVRATLRSVELSDEDACDDADEIGRAHV